jgi:Rrf2 family protein
MLKFSAKSQYGLRAMVCLAMSRGEIFSLKEVSKREGISFDYLEKIFSKLEKAKLIKAKRGVQGGYFLIKKPAKIKVGKIIRILEGEVALVKCINRQNKFLCPHGGKCLTRNFWKKIQDSLNKTLDSLTLADLIKK